MNKLTVRDLSAEQIRGRRALVRVDFNVPLDEHRHVTDDTRIRAAIPTLEFLLSRDARVVLLSHLGRPKGKPDPKYSLGPVAARLAELMPRRKVTFVESTDTDEAQKASAELGDGEIIVLENTRFLGGEETNDERLARALAQLGDFYVNDAFGAAHRAHASTEGVAHFLQPAVAGLLMEKELAYLHGALENPQRPFVAILGGSKISGKIDVIHALLPKVDALLIGGAMACTFYKAMGLETGKSLVEEDRVDMARRRRRCPRRTFPPTWRCSTSGPAPRNRTAARSPARARCCGTGRWACSRNLRSTRGRSRSRRRWRTRRRRAPRRSSAAATRPRRWSRRGWRRA
jgi:phosphoglycerate kinase